MEKFIPGLKLSEYFFTEAVQPLLKQFFPHLSYSAARLGWGSDVLGFDTPMSIDHGWGPKLTLFLSGEDFVNHQKSLDDFFAHHLPFTIREFPTHFAEPYADGGIMTMKKIYPIHHMITITTVSDFFLNYLGVDLDQPLSPEVWLTLPQQRLRTLKGGRIYHDGLSNLSETRQRFHTGIRTTYGSMCLPINGSASTRTKHLSDAPVV